MTLACLLAAACHDNNSPVETTGAIRVSSATTGALLDPDGYSVGLDGGAGRPVEVTGGLLIPDVAPGDHALALSGVVCNCALAEPQPVAVAVSAGDTAEASFSITCEEIGRLALADGGDIYRIDLDGSNRTRLTHGLGARSPRWSPDGSKIAYVIDSNGYIGVMNADGSGQTMITQTATDLAPSWSPDGRKLVFAHFGEIYTMDADGGDVRRLTNDAEADREPAWSPDGNRIAFISTRGPGDFSSDIYTITPDGSQITSLVEGGHFTRHSPAWSLDGNMIVYQSLFPTLIGLHIMTLDGSPIPYYAVNLVDDGFYPAWSPGGSWIAFREFDGIGLIHPDRTETRLLTGGLSGLGVVPRGRPVMADDQRVYSDEEFALILRQAAELASRAEPPGPSSAGLTLTEMKAAAAQVGFDPALVERAARLLAARASASPLERLIGGPLRHDHEARFPIKLDENRAARLLSAVRISAGQAGSLDAGHSSSMGMTWHDGGEMEALGVTARPEENGTSVSVVLDRRGTLGVAATFSGIAMFLAALAGGGLYDVAPSLGFGASIAGMGGALAVARRYWVSSTRKARERISVVMDAIGQTLTQPETQASGFGTVGDGAPAPEPDARAIGDRS